MFILDLNGNWKMKNVNNEKWIEASVPGSVYLDMLNAQIIDDPYFGENEKTVRDISYNDFEYERDFEVSEQLFAEQKVFLVCEGIDTCADIYINNSFISSVNNMHCTYRFDIKKYIRQGANKIKVYFHSPTKYVEQKNGELRLRKAHGAMDGAAHIRKASYMFGWDWGPQLPDMGIWKSILIKGYSNEALEDVYITQKHRNGTVDINIHVKKEKWVDQESSLRVDIKNPEGAKISKEITSHNIEEYIHMKIENPMLWWPNGYGDQPLYTIDIVLKKDETILDFRKYRIGLRTITVNQEKDQWGKSFAFNVNGIPIFAMGADYIPEDNLLGRCSYKRSEKLIKSCEKANFNCIRIWGGGIYPNDYFLDLCDEYGIIIWQDLMFACMVYNMENDFIELISKEISDNAKRIRHHACLGLWCGNNEIEWMLHEGRFSTVMNPKLKDDYIKQFEVLLPELVKRLDPNTFFWGSSPSSGYDSENPNDEKFGDMHYWEVWHDTKPFSVYRDTFPRFMSEFGLQSFPGMKTIESFTFPEDRNIFSSVMENHQKNEGCNVKIFQYISENYKYPKDLASLVYLSQIIQAEGIKYGVEHWRRIRGRCMGTIYWQLNDCWPAASWSSLDYYGRWKALHYYAKRFYAPVIASICEKDEKLELHVTNEKLDEFEGVLEWKLCKKDGDILAKGSKGIYVPAMSSQMCERLDFIQSLNNLDLKRETYFAYKLKMYSNIVDCGTLLFVKPKHFKWKKPQFDISVEEIEDRFIITIKSNAFAKYVEVEFTKYDAILSDNYFDILPGETKKVEICKNDMESCITLSELRKQLKVTSLVDTYQ